LQELPTVATPEELARVIDAVLAAPLIAVDTEFVRESTYYPELCLIQIASETLVACIDCLAPLDLEPLYNALLRPDCTWLVHSARQDLEVIWQRTGRLPAQLIDTQVAAALTGMPPQIGLEGLLERTVGIVLGESFARTDWSRRPLPEAAVRYALDDVRYMLAAWRHLQTRLDALGRGSWVEEDCRRLLADPPVADAVTVWTRLRTTRNATAEQQAAALALVEWRELAAQRSNRPRRWILADDLLLAIAQALPASLAELEPVVSARFAIRFGEAVLAAVAARTDERLRAIVAAQNARALPDKQKLRELQELARRRAAELGLEPEILATRRDLAALAIGDPPPSLSVGWRAAELGRAGVAAALP
jgi:ribonuclease D